MKEGIIYTLAKNSKRESLEELKRLLYNGSLTMVSYIRIPNNLFLSLKRNYTRKKFLKKIVNIVKKELGDFDIKIILDLRIEGNNFKEVAKTILKYYDYIDAITFSGELLPWILPEIKENFPKLELILYSNLEEKKFFQKDILKYSKIFYDLANVIGEFQEQKNLEKKLYSFCDFVVIPEPEDKDSQYNEWLQNLCKEYEIDIIKEKNNLWAILYPE